MSAVSGRSAQGRIACRGARNTRGLGRRSLGLAAIVLLGLAGLSTAALKGFVADARRDELVTTLTLLDGVTVHINAPANLAARVGRLTRLVFYALPNGNTIAWTVGRQVGPADDWHFGIQHIGAQTRHVRRLVPDENIVVVYLEAPGRSWPAWRGRHGAEAPRLALDLVTSVSQRFAAWQPRIELTAHSGGGSFLFACIDAGEEIPAEVRRLVFLDADYGFDAAAGHGRKLARWLGAADGHVLAVAAYDDREVLWQGRPLVGPTGGTWRATQRMLAALEREGDGLTSSVHDGLVEVRGFRGRFRAMLHPNPQRRILHTVLVERNGFAWGLLVASPAEAAAPPFFGEPAYGQFIAPGPLSADKVSTGARTSSAAAQARAAVGVNDAGGSGSAAHWPASNCGQ